VLIDTNVVKKDNNREFYDMFAVSQVAFDMVKGGGIGCSMRDSEMINECSICPVSGICSKVKGLIDGMRADATTVEKEFIFG